MVIVSATMSITRLFSIIGDSNVRNNMTPFNIRDRPGLSDAQVLSSSRLEVLPDALRSVRTSSNILIISCISNFIIASEESSSVSGRIGPVLADVRQHIDTFCLSRQSTLVLIAPPMYRTRPYWYTTSLPEVLMEFSAVVSANRPPNLHLLEGFATPEFLQDGVHLTPYSGLRFVVHLFDAATSRSTDPAPPPELDRTN